MMSYAVDRKAFSLLELLIVLTLMTVCIGIIVPASQTWIRRTDELHVKAIWEEALRVARVRALESGLDHSIRFDPTHSTLLVCHAATEGVNPKSDYPPARFPCPRKTHIKFVSHNGKKPLDYLRVDANGNADRAMIEISRNESSNQFKIHRFHARLISDSVLK
ncbi:MAG: prepilin-type N-terminal cleavage/methylation domain-containing protein [Pirellula sp.]|jgi:prepilin-type N-terminal cleavage/methylation domain-containing protein|nr:prepilin-type N-terminal cleavage/methylation domain-containing protein [Pirellula sp.]